MFPHMKGLRMKKNCPGHLSALALILTLAAWMLCCCGTDVPGRSESVDPAMPDRITVPCETPIEEIPILSDQYTYIKKDTSLVYEGDLILINGHHEYRFQNQDIITVYGNKSKYYKVRDTKVSLNRAALDSFNWMMEAFYKASGKYDVMLVSGYRDLEFQQQLLDQRIASQGEEVAKMFVAMPGHSEHHSGLAVDLNVYTDAGESFTIDTDENYQWVFDHAWEYGWILRYQAHKTEITGTADEPWHFRYVGVPHAYYMEQNDLCFEEYIELLAGYTSDGSKLQITLPDGMQYEVYSVSCDMSRDTADVPVPKDCVYEISGNNIDGFIVTYQASSDR